MARKTIQVRIKEDGRDQGKVFLITEMAASQAERWAIRAFFALGSTGVDLPEGIEHTGFAGIAKAGLELLCKVPFDLAEPLLDEIMGCVSILPNPADQSVVRKLVEDDIEEISTRLKLRVEAFKLHADFLMAANPSTSAQIPAAGRKRA